MDKGEEGCPGPHGATKNDKPQQSVYIYARGLHGNGNYGIPMGFP